MSHFSKLRTRIKDQTLLEKCLKAMGFKVTKDADIRGHSGKQRVDLAITTGEGYSIGFRRDLDDVFQIVADWYEVKGTGKHAFAAKLKMRFEEMENQIRREYALSTVLEKAKENGFTVVEKTENADGTIRLIARRWRE